MSPEAIAAFVSGVAAVMSALVSLHLERKRAEKACLERIKEIRESLKEGYEMGHG